MNLGCTRKSRKAVVVGGEQTRTRLEGDEARNNMGNWHGGGGGDTRMAVVTLGDMEASAGS